MTETSCWLRQLLRAVAAAGAGLMALAVARRWCRRVTVHGASMVPALMPGDRVLVVATRRRRPGEIVAVPDPRQPERLLVKRVAQVDRMAATVSVLGDNAHASTDSRTFGPLSSRSVIGRVVYRYSPAERAGRIRHSGRSPGRTVH